MASHCIFFFFPIIRKPGLVTQIISIIQGPRDSCIICCKTHCKVLLFCQRPFGWLGLWGRGKRRVQAVFPPIQQVPKINNLSFWSGVLQSCFGLVISMRVNFNEAGEVHRAGAHGAGIVIDFKTTALPTLTWKSLIHYATLSPSTETPDYLQNYWTLEVFLIVLQSFFQLGCPLLIPLKNS